jgi:phosphoserine aminotransferase
METETQIEESERLAPNAQEQSGSTNNSDDGASSNPASTENSDSTAYTHSTNNATADGSTITEVGSSLPASPAASNSFLATNANSPPLAGHFLTI